MRAPSLLVAVALSLVACAKPNAQDEAPAPRASTRAPDEVPAAATRASAEAMAPTPKIATSAVPDADADNECDGRKCSGATTSDIDTALAFRARQAQRCYDNALAQDPTLHGRISVSVRIASNGTTCSAAVAVNELTTAPAVARCVAGYFRGQALPAPKGGCVDATVPMNFVQRQ